MVAAQTALAMFLLIGAGLFIRTLANLRSADLGFRTEGLLYARIEPRSGGLVQAQRRQFFEDAVARLRRLPGVSAAAAAGVAPLGGDVSVGVGKFRIRHLLRGTRRDTTPEIVEVNGVSPGYFRRHRGADRRRTRLHASDTSAASAQQRPPADREPGTCPQDVPKGIGSRARNQDGKRLHEAAGRLDDCGCRQRQSRRSAQPGGRIVPAAGRVSRASHTDRANARRSHSMIPTVRRAMTELNANTPTFSEAPLTDPSSGASAVSDYCRRCSRHLRRSRFSSAAWASTARCRTRLNGAARKSVCAWPSERKPPTSSG